MAITKKQREEYRAQLIADNPRTEPYFIDMLLDVYETAPTFVDTITKKHARLPRGSDAAPKKPLEQKAITCIPDGEFLWPAQEEHAKVLSTEELCNITEIKHEAHTAVTQSA